MSVQNKIPYYLIASLVAIIILQRSCNNNIDINDDKITVKTDTVWKVTKDTVFKTVNAVKTEYIYIDKEAYKSGE